MKNSKRKSLINSIRREMPPAKQVFRDKKRTNKLDVSGRKIKYKKNLTSNIS